MSCSYDQDGVMCSSGDEEEGEEAFALRVALLRVHRLQLLSGAASGEAALLKSLDKLLAVGTPAHSQGLLQFKWLKYLSAADLCECCNKIFGRRNQSCGLSRRQQVRGISFRAAYNGD